MKILTELLKTYGAQYSTAFIYSIFALISLVCAVVLFGFLEGTGILKIVIPDYVDEAEFGGAITGFIVTMLILIRSYLAVFSNSRLIIKGNVFSVNGSPIVHALVFIDGIDKQKHTDETGWFSIEVDNFNTEWTVRATYEGLSAQTEVTTANILKPVRLEIKGMEEGVSKNITDKKKQ